MAIGGKNRCNNFPMLSNILDKKSGHQYNSVMSVMTVLAISYAWWISIFKQIACPICGRKIGHKIAQDFGLVECL